MVRQYITAKIDQDYEKAARLYNGKTAQELRKWDEETLKIRFVRLVLISEPFPWKPPGPRG